MDDRISRQVFVWQTMRERLVAQHELEENDPALIDTLDGMTDLNEQIVAVCMSAREDEENAEALQRIINDMRLRKTRLKRRAEYKRGQAAWAMQETGQASIKSPSLTLSQRMGRPKLIIDEDRLPMDFKKSKVTYSADKDLIQSAVDRGDVPEGVQIANPMPILTIGRK